MLAAILLYLLGKAAAVDFPYWAIYWIFVAWKILELIGKIYQAGKEESR